MAAFDLLAEGGAAFMKAFWDGGAEIDEVTIVAHYLVDASFCESLFPKSDLLLRESTTMPLALIASEKLDRGGANFLPFV